MRFKEFARFSLGDDVANYLSTHLKSALRELHTGLSRLAFNDNFETFTYEGTWTTGEVKTVKNTLGVVPSAWMVIDSIEGEGLFDRGDETWTDSVVYIRNSGGDTSTAKLMFFK